MSKYNIHCNVSEDGSEFILTAEKDGVIVDTQTEYCFEDVMFNSIHFFNRVCDKYHPDTRFDHLEVNLHHIF